MKYLEKINNLIKHSVHYLKKKYLILKPYCLNPLYKVLQKKEVQYLYTLLKPYRKYIYPALGGIFITMNLFYIMTVLISQKEDQYKKNTNNISINFLSSKQLEELKIKDRRLPTKTKTQKDLPIKPQLNTQLNISKPKLSIPQQALKLPKDFSKKGNFSSSGNNSFNSRENSEVTPIVRIEPSYPRKAAMTGVEGFVILQFDITPSGTVTNISILQASPPQIFNQSAIRALQKWKYKPKIINNKSVIHKKLKVQLDFKLEK